jgi:hypothetical protein
MALGGEVGVHLMRRATIVGIMLALLIAGCSGENPVETELNSNLAGLAQAPPAHSSAPLILTFHEEDPGPPYYANFAGDVSTYGRFIPNDGEWAGIMFFYPPKCVPQDFNLLERTDPRASDCRPVTVKTKLWFDPDTFPDAPPLQIHTQEGEGGVPIYFVKMSNLETAMDDDFLNIDELHELQETDSLLIGNASFLQWITHNSYQAPGRSFGNEQFTAKGNLEDGRSFQFHYNEEGFDIDGQLTHIFPNVEIIFN